MASILSFSFLQRQRHTFVVRVLERAERMMIRCMCGVTLKDRCKSEELRKRLDIEDVADVVRRVD